MLRGFDLGGGVDVRHGWGSEEARRGDVSQREKMARDLYTSGSACLTRSGSSLIAGWPASRLDSSLEFRGGREGGRDPSLGM